MYEFLEIPVRLINGLVTLGIAFFLLRIYQKNKKRFYSLWALGFFLYGLNIITRIGTVPTIGQWLPAFLLLGGFISIIAGIADLVDRRRLILVVFILPLSLLMLSIVPFPETIMIEALGWVISIMPYLIITVSLLYIRMNYPSSLDLLIVGWLNLLLVNIAFPLNMMDIVYIDFLATFSKIIIFFGMLNPNFSLMVDELKRFLIAGVPSTYSNEVSGSFILVSSGPGNRKSEIDWMATRIEENATKGISTILISTYDLISQYELSNRGLSEKVFVVRMIPGGRGVFTNMDERLMTIDDDVNQLDILFTDLIKYSNERKINIEIIVFTLSSLIHTHGWKRIYSFMLSKIPTLRASNVQLLCFYYHDSHENISDIAKFETTADKVINVA